MDASVIQDEAYFESISISFEIIWAATNFTPFSFSLYIYKLRDLIKAGANLLSATKDCRHLASQYTCVEE